MEKSKPNRKRFNPSNVMLRRSPRLMDTYKNLMDMFEKLPNEVILIILSKISDPKTLIRCYLVSKRFASLVSAKTGTLSIRVDLVNCELYSQQKPKCPETSHDHTPVTAILFIFRIFPNLEHLKINLCQTPYPDYTRKEVHWVKAMCEPSSTALSIESCSAFRVFSGQLATLTAREVEVCRRELHEFRYPFRISFSMTLLLWFAVVYRPKSMKSIVLVWDCGKDLRRLRGKKVFQLKELRGGKIKEQERYFSVENEIPEGKPGEVFYFTKQIQHFPGDSRDEDIRVTDVEELLNDDSDDDDEQEEEEEEKVET